MNALFSSGQVVTIATAETYTVKSDEVFLNDQLYKKVDLEIIMYNNDDNIISTTSGLLVIGKTYNVVATLGGDSFANVGWVTDGVDFVATGTTPTTWASSSIVINVTDSPSQEAVRVGVQLRDGAKTLPAGLVHYSKWDIDTVTQTSLSALVENINTAIL